MDKIDLIEERSFGDKFNELTGFIYDNFKLFAKWAFMFVLPSSFVMAAIIQFLPDAESVRWLKMMLCIMIVTLLALVMMTIVKHHFAEGIGLKRMPKKKYVAEMLRNVGVGLYSVFVFEVIISFMAFALIGLLDSSDNDFVFMLSLSFYFVILAVLSLPIFHTMCAVVIEGKSGFEAMKRGLQMLQHKPYMSVIFLGTMTVIGYLLPFISSIPYFIYRAVEESIAEELTVGRYSIGETLEIVFLTICLMCYSLQLIAMSVGMMFDFGNAVEKVDNVSFMKKYNDFENL